MTMNPTSILRLIVLAGIAFQPLAALAQESRPAAPRTSTQAPAEATAPAARGAGVVPGTRPWHEEEYRLGPGDKLRVDIYREDQLSQSLQVRPDGKITMPLVGDIQAAGRTAIELRDEVTRVYKEYFTDPVVTVIVQEAVANQVYVIGEVPNPGAITLQGPITIIQALADAGGLKEFANQRRIRIVRNDGETIVFDYRDYIRNGNGQAIYLRPGDTVVVP